MADCSSCIFQPDWEIDFKSDNLYGECKKDNEPVLKIDGKFYVDGTGDTVAILERCKNHRRTKNG